MDAYFWYDDQTPPPTTPARDEDNDDLIRLPLDLMSNRRTDGQTPTPFPRAERKSDALKAREKARPRDPHESKLSRSHSQQDITRASEPAREGCRYATTSHHTTPHHTHKSKSKSKSMHEQQHVPCSLNETQWDGMAPPSSARDPGRDDGGGQRLPEGGYRFSSP